MSEIQLRKFRFRLSFSKTNAFVFRNGRVPSAERTRPIDGKCEEYANAIGAKRNFTLRSHADSSAQGRKEKGANCDNIQKIFVLFLSNG